MKKVFLYLGLVLLILLLAAFSISLWLVQSTGARVARQRAAISAAGDKLYLTEYARDPIPDEENAFYYLQQAKVDLEAFDNKHSAIRQFDFTRRWSAAELDEVASLVEDFSNNSQLYKQIKRAAACRQYDAQLDYSAGLSVELPHLTWFRSAARALQAKAMLLAYRGEGDAALAECERSLRLTLHLQCEPILISHLVSIGSQNIAVQSVNHALRVAETSPPARKRLDEALARFDNRQGSVDALKGERAMGTLVFDQFRRGDFDATALDNGMRPFNLLSSTWFGQAYINDDEDKYLQLMDCYIRAGDADDAGPQAPLYEVEVELEHSGVRHVMTRMLIPALGAVYKASRRDDTRNHCLRVLLALQERDEAKLADLGLPDAVTRDAAGVPLVIRKTDNGWLVYGVGTNGIDDGGNFDDSSGDPLDIGLGPLGEPLPLAPEGR